MLDVVLRYYMLFPAEIARFMSQWGQVSYGGLTELSRIRSMSPRRHKARLLCIPLLTAKL